MMLDCDEGLGSVLYDRAKFADDAESWRGHNASLYHQTFQVIGTDTIFNSIG